LMACLWQARPNLIPSQLYLAIEKSASQYTNPDSLLGYGIPDYAKALQLAPVILKNKPVYRVYPNPFTEAFTVSFDSTVPDNYEISFISAIGAVIRETKKMIPKGLGNSITINDLDDLKPGLYILKIASECTTTYIHLVKITK